MQFDQALEACRSARPAVEPNLGFVAQLRALDRSLRRSRFSWFEKGKGEKGKGKFQTNDNKDKGDASNRGNAAGAPIPTAHSAQTQKGAVQNPFTTPGPAQPAPTMLDSELHPDVHHVASAASATPRDTSARDDNHINNPKGFSRSATELSVKRTGTTKRSATRCRKKV